MEKSFEEEFKQFFEKIDENKFDMDRFVPAVGSLDSRIIMVGEAPGENEVVEKEPFVGRAGNELDKALNNLDVERDKIYITNLVKERPPNNRDPKSEEIEFWKPLLDMEIEKVDPELIITLGNFASKELTGSKKGITQIRGKVFNKNGRNIMPIYHPAAVLYDRSKQEKFQEDLSKAFGKNLTKQSSLKDL